MHSRRSRPYAHGDTGRVHETAAFRPLAWRYLSVVWLLRPPGVYRPQGDTDLLTDALDDAAIPPGAKVLDLCTGTGALAIAAARRGAGEVTAVDISSRAVLAVRANALMRRLPIKVIRGDLLAPISHRRFDTIMANPPYVPSEDRPPPRHGRARAWDAGLRGRKVLDRICSHAPPLLADGGTLLLVHSALCGVGATVDRLRDSGLKTSVIGRRYEPFGPVMRARAGWLEAHGLIQPGQRHDELVVIRADRTC